MNKWIISAGRRGIFLAILLLAAALVLPEGGFSAPPEGSGKGSHGQNRKPSDPGGTIKGDILGDLWVVLRNVGTGDEGNGRPIKVRWTWPETLIDPETGDLVINHGNIPTGYEVIPYGDPDYNDPDVCVQPISEVDLSDWPEGVAQTRIQSWTTENDSLFVNSYGNHQNVYLIPLDNECNIPDAYANTWGTQVIEIDSGRLALARTTQYVLGSAYEEALSILNTACQEDANETSDCEIGLDPAGRLTYTTGEIKSTIDSPRENLALYQRVMLDGCLSTPTSGAGLTDATQRVLSAGELSYLVCDDTPSGPDNSDLQRAASFLAGAADKSGAIGIDEVVYLNSTLGINTVETSPTDGSLFVTGYFNFGDFEYWRSDVYYRNPPTEVVTANLLQPPPATETANFDDDGYPTRFDVAFNVPIAPLVFGADDNNPIYDWNGTNDYTDMPIVNFVRAADDAVSVVFYIHNYELPVYPVPIEPTPAPGNGLQQQNQLQGPVFLQ